jgi:hypothetical protein
MRLDSSGNLGIGVTSPGQKVSIAAPSTAQAIGIWNRTSDNVYGGIYFKTSDGATDQCSILNERSGTNGAGLLFYTKPDGGSASERARIDSSGNLLVGTTSNQGTGRISLIPTSGGTNCINTQSSANAYYVGIWYTNTTTLAGYITVTNNATSYATSSDQRLKENIVDAPSAIDSINAIKVRSFDWKSDGSHVDYGHIAQELLEVVPEAVAVGPDEMMGVDFGKLTPRIIKALQEITQRLEALEAK